MPKQKNQHLERFLDSLSLDSPANITGYQSEVVCYPILSSGIDKNRKPVNFETPGAKLWFETFDGFSIDSLLGIIDGCLRRTKHAQSKGLALAVLGMYIVLRGDRHDADYFYEMLESSISSDVTFYYIFPRIENFTGEMFTAFNLGEYHFGKLNAYQMGKQSRRAKSDYFERYENELLNRLAIERRFKDVTLINWWKYRNTRKLEISRVPKMAQLFNELSENYFDRLSVALFEIFLREISDEQDLTTALGSSYFSEQDLILFPLVERVAIFHDVDGKKENGFVKPIKSGAYALDLAQIDSKLPATKEMLKRDYNFIEFSQFEIHQTLRSFSKFFAKAKKYKSGGQLEDAFLHFVIPLDMLFGKRGSSLDSVARRAAALTYKSEGVSYGEQVRRVKELYDERSKYVHAGKSPDGRLLTEAEAVAGECMLCLLRLQKDENRRREITIDKWIIDIDLIIALVESGREPDNELISKCGISIA